jgi:hypothetical protein
MKKKYRNAQLSDIAYRIELILAGKVKPAMRERLQTICWDLQDVIEDPKDPKTPPLVGVTLYSAQKTR